MMETWSRQTRQTAFCLNSVHLWFSTALMSIKTLQCQQHSCIVALWHCGVSSLKYCILKYITYALRIHFIYCVLYIIPFLSGHSEPGILFPNQICSLCIAFAVEIETFVKFVFSAAVHWPPTWRCSKRCYSWQSAMLGFSMAVRLSQFGSWVELGEWPG